MSGSLIEARSDLQNLVRGESGRGLDVDDRGLAMG